MANILFVVADKGTRTLGEDWLNTNVLAPAGHVVTWADDDDPEVLQDAYDCAILSDSCNFGKTGFSGYYKANWSKGVIVGSTGWVARNLAGTLSGSSRDQLAISDANSPLAAGLTSPVTVFTTAQAVGYSASVGTAILAFKLTTSVNYVIFTYEAGAALVGGSPAPGRRIAMGLKEASWNSLTADGQTIWLNAVDYAATLPNAAPTVTINEAGQALPVGASFDFTATADDAEDGDLTASIGWSVSDALVLSITGATTGGSTTVKKIGAGSAQLLADVSDSADTPASQASVTITDPAATGGFDKARFIIHALGGII